jgi:hypothetical protein
MMRVLYGWAALMFIYLGVGAYLLFTATLPQHRRRAGLCAVPGCGRAAGHWKALTPVAPGGSK